MNEPDVSKSLEKNELDASQAEEVAGGLDLCSPDQLRDLTAALKESYDNLVDFTSYVIERVAGGR
jgi:hypothetical protein